MKTIVFRSWLIAILLALLSISVALAHGQPVISVQPTSAAPGGQITITGTDMEEGEVFAITLENATGVIPLGEATAVKDGDEAGFAVTLTLPEDLAPGFYLVRAATEEGEATTADLTIVALAEQAGGEAMPMEATAALHVLDRTKSGLQIGVVALVALVSAALGFRLIRNSE